MQYVHDQENIKLTKEAVIILGNFDGVHKGHQKLIEKAREIAKDNQLVVVALSFYPHPTMILSKEPKPLIMSRKERKDKMEQMGIEVFIEYPFTKSFAEKGAKIFVEEVLINKLKAKMIVVGSNYFFGKNKEGNVTFMKEIASDKNVEICEVDMVEEEERVISSTRIRAHITKGEMEEVTKLLGYPYTVKGNVSYGKQLGRTIGFPTINLLANEDRIYPPNGVYVTKIKVYNEMFMGITNIGINPTVGSHQKVIETHIFDFDETVYEEEVEVYFLHFIRCEQKFSDMSALAYQINKDKELARKMHLSR